jgi:hypothetical protein
MVTRRYCPSWKQHLLTLRCQVHPFQQIKITYESFSSLLIERQFVRCHPSFYGRPRYDIVLLSLPDGFQVFARIRFLFAVKALALDWQLALVTMFRTINVDCDTGLRRVIEDKDVESVFIDVSWVVRTVYAAEDSGTFLIIDVIDSDMYLRFLNRTIV